MKFLMTIQAKKEVEELTVLIFQFPAPTTMGFANAYSLSLNKFE
jgi:hypothetical protein